MVPVVVIVMRSHFNLSEHDSYKCVYGKDKLEENRTTKAETDPEGDHPGALLLLLLMKSRS